MASGGVRIPITGNAWSPAGAGCAEHALGRLNEAANAAVGAVALLGGGLLKLGGDSVKAARDAEAALANAKRRAIYRAIERREARHPSGPHPGEVWPARSNFSIGV